MKKRTKTQNHILRELSLLARLERRARRLTDPVARRRVLSNIHGRRAEFLLEDLPAL